MNKFLSIFLYVAGIICLFLYSYTQVDLSLTLSRISIWQTIEKSFQYIGYFQRPLSTYLYVGILISLLASYVGLLMLIRNNVLSRKTVWILVIATAVILTFSYNAFSYDLFNYIFDAKIVTHYFQNPYMHKALDFPHDPMLSFMHWTQRIYPYGPIWLFITIPISFVGMQFFLPTFFLFKALASISYLGIAWSVEKILKKTDPQNSLFGIAVFAFSPLVIIEGLVSAHNDMVMVLFISLALVTFMNKKSVWSFLLLFLSIGIKFATAVLLPLWIIGTFIKKKGEMESLALVSFILLIIPLVVASLRTNFQPWYILFLFPFASLMPKQKEILVGFTLFSFTALFQYIPFLYIGNWDNPIPFILLLMLWSSVGLSIVVSVCMWVLRVAKRR
ncbi:MAG TPA: hypothetical protein VEW42_06335 [Candidatus Eisenbacteria bacterium]|nr:hypothetical protein [Candidatus Eisenbacteria bacterium]